MRKNYNGTVVTGYVYDASKLAIKESGPASKNPGTVYITGDIDIAVDEDGLNIVTEHFTYVTEKYKSGKTNDTFVNLKKIIENSDEKTWLKAGKDNAYLVKITGSIGLNDFFNAEGERVSAKRNEGNFVSFVSALPEEIERNTFSVDMLITGVEHIDANEEKGISEHTSIRGAIFDDFHQAILPMDFIVKNEGGMKWFEDLGVTKAEPIYTKVWGRINRHIEKVESIEESAFGENAVRVSERKVREYVITGTPKVPAYDFGDDEQMTTEDVKKMMQNREIAWGEIKKRNDEYLASKSSGSNAFGSTPIVKATKDTSGFDF